MNSIDYMAGACWPSDHSLLGCVTNRIINDVRDRNRATCEIKPNPPDTIEWE